MAAAPVFVVLALLSWWAGSATLVICNLLIALFLIVFDPF